MHTKLPTKIYLLLLLLLAVFASYDQALAFGDAFNKPIDSVKVDRILNLTSQEDLLKIIQNDLKLYRIDIGDQPKVLLSQINSSIANLEKTPTIIVTAIGQSVLNKLLGLFLPFEEHSSILKKDVILFRDDADAWTVTHEYFHFLFSKSRRQNRNQDDPNFKAILQDSAETYNEMRMAYLHNNNSFLRSSQRSEYITAVQNILKHKINNILNFSVEEVLIEQRLQQHYPLQKAKLLTEEDYNYSFKYLQENLRLAIRETQYVLNLIIEVRKVLAADMPPLLKADLDLYFEKYEKILKALPKPVPVEEEKAKTVETVLA